jgi:hypothetical protein
MEGYQPSLLAVIAAALAGFLIGGLWYSPLLLGERWMAAAQVTPERIAASNKPRTFGLAFIALLIMSYCLAMFIGPIPEISEGFYTPSQQGAFYGFLAGFGWVFFAFVVVGLFELRSRNYILINGGYWIVTMTSMGAILGGWR